nr:PREDICTED: uncharacterized protein LOC107079020 [Lepisosteus oculatus]
MAGAPCDDRRAVATPGLGQGAWADSVRTARGQEVTHIRDRPFAQRLASKPQPVSYRGGRPMHRSTLQLGGRLSDTSYVTTHAHYYSGRDGHGHLSAVPRAAQYPSQHHGTLDLSHSALERCQSHSRDAFGPKETTPHYVLHENGVRNRSHSQNGLGMSEVTNPPATRRDYSTTYRTAHCRAAPQPVSARSTGLPTHWHNYNIITGEEQLPAVPGHRRRRAGDRVLWESRRWESDCCSLRLY